MIARKLAPDNRIICASVDYLAKFGEPQTPKEIQHHQCINLIGMDSWMFMTPTGQRNVKTNGQLRADNGEAIRDACVDGLGIAISSTWCVYQHLLNGKLVQILQDYPLAYDTAIWVVYPSSRQLAPKVRAFIDYFAQYFKGIPYWDQQLNCL